MGRVLWNAVSPIDRYARQIEQWAVAAAGVLVFVMLVTVTYSSITRYMFSAPLGWALQFTSLVLICVNALPLAAVLRRGEHIVIDVVFVHLPPVVRPKVLLAAYGLSLAIVGLFAWGTSAAAVDSLVVWDESPSPYRMPLFPVKAVMALALLLFCLENLLVLARMALGRSHGASD